MLRWLRSPRLLFYVTICLALCLSLLLPAAPVAAQTPVPQAAVPQTLNFVNGVAQVQGAISSNQPQDYLFFGTQGQTVRVQLQTQQIGANFEVTGANSVIYKQFGDPSLDWTFTLPISQNYRITVNSLQPAVFTLIVTLNGGGGVTPQRLNFVNNTAQVTGSAAAGQSPQYVFFANGGQQVRIVLISPGNLANFGVRGVTDGVTYKQPTDPSRDWTFALPTGQDYVITVSAPSPVNFTLQVFLLGPQPPPAERINFAPGQSTVVVSGNLQANVPKYYIVYVAAGQQLRLLLTSSPAGSANFAINGVSDGIVYKQLTDPSREVTITAPTSQDYLITLFSNVPASYQLEVTIPTPLPPTTPPPTLTPLPTLPTGCVNTPLQNGGFENDGFWVFGDDPVPPAYVSSPVQAGLRSVRLGIDPALGSAVQNKKSFSSIRQPIQIPMEATVAQLRWYHFYRTEEAQTDDPGLGSDQQQVILLNPDLSTHAVLVRVRRNDNAWVADLRDLTSFRGKSLILYFNVYNDGNGQRTWQFLDEVYIYACYPEVTPTPFVPTSTPMPIVATVAGPTAAAATLVFPTSPAVATFVATVFPTLAAVMPPLGGQMGNGEPDIVLVPPGQTSQNALAAAAVQAQVQPTPIPSVATPVSTRSGLRIFDRPASEVLTWTAIMVGAIAIIGILVALIWQASRRDEPMP